MLTIYCAVHEINCRDKEFYISPRNNRGYLLRDSTSDDGIFRANESTNCRLRLTARDGQSIQLQTYNLVTSSVLQDKSILPTEGVLKCENSLSIRENGIDKIFPICSTDPKLRTVTVTKTNFIDLGFISRRHQTRLLLLYDGLQNEYFGVSKSLRYLNKKLLAIQCEFCVHSLPYISDRLCNSIGSDVIAVTW